MIDLDKLTVRELQKESARVLASSDGFGNNELVKFNKSVNQDSVAWYKAVISWYMDRHGGLPSRIGPATSVMLALDD